SPSYNISLSNMYHDRVVDFEGASWGRTYKIGLGMVHYQFYDGGNDLTTDSSLTYYRKSGVACGVYVQPELVTLVKNLYNPTVWFDIYPNPTTNLLTVASSNKIDNITITNLLGQTVYSHEYNTEKVEVNVANLPS